MVGIAVQAMAGTLTVSVRNGAHARENVIVAQRMTREWAASAATAGLAERHPDGRFTPVPFAVDNTGEAPVLVWQMPGATAPDAVRRFEWRADHMLRAAPGGDLTVSVDGSRILVANGYFRLAHPVRGRGGFPQDIAYVRSGHADADLYFLDRIVRKDADGRVMQYCANACEDAAARVVFASPLRTVVEVQTGFGPRAAETPGRPRAVYRYTYNAHSPVVQVDARYTRTDDGPWRELHFLHLSRKDTRFEGGLYFGPAGDTAWYSQWLGRERAPEVSLFKDGRPWVPVERDPPDGAYRLENAALRVAFAGACLTCRSVCIGTTGTRFPLITPIRNTSRPNRVWPRRRAR